MREIDGVTFCGRPVRNPIFAIPIVIILMLLVIVMVPVWLPLHFILRAFGLRGFITSEPYYPPGRLLVRLGEARKRYSFNFNRDSFRRL